MSTPAPTPSPSAAPSPLPPSGPPRTAPPATGVASAAWSVSPEDVGSADAAALWRAYYTEVSDRYYLLHEGRRSDPDQLARGIAAETGETLRPPGGTLLVARYDGVAAGTAGVRLLGDPEEGVAELKRVFLLPRFRGRGGAALLIGAAEDAARALGARRLILDTRSDLVEARALYARLGYRETAPYNDDAYAEHWYAKELPPPDRPPTARKPAAH
ncbi:GNAT family N-acetyltransferase [Streptomyces fragilis]|uniref:GNAT family N-acetyltransferase n=1 Tax=Streptomyces fragilis TaxID=67301 RepID=A0ABV2YAX2_9ACTN|nr:GNAT family N-acetyltransferase [Streptomyces fragilis]